MEQKAPEVIFALLIICGLFGSIGVLSFARSSLRREFRSLTMELATIVSVGATLGSLYFSEIPFSGARENVIPAKNLYFWRQNFLYEKNIFPDPGKCDSCAKTFVSTAEMYFLRQNLFPWPAPKNLYF